MGALRGGRTGVHGDECVGVGVELHEGALEMELLGVGLLGLVDRQDLLRNHRQHLHATHSTHAYRGQSRRSELGNRTEHVPRRPQANDPSAAHAYHTE